MTTSSLSHEHLARDLSARVLDRLASQEPARVAMALEEQSLTHEPRLLVGAGMILEGFASQASALSQTALNLVASALQCSLKINPAASAIAQKDLVLLSPGLEEAHSNAKALEARLGCQIKAIAHSGAIGVVALDQFNGWPAGVRQRVTSLLSQAQHPRVFLIFGQAPSFPALGASPFLAKCTTFSVAQEPSPVLARRLRQGP